MSTFISRTKLQAAIIAVLNYLYGEATSMTLLLASLVRLTDIFFSWDLVVLYFLRQAVFASPLLKNIHRPRRWDKILMRHVAADWEGLDTYVLVLCTLYTGRCTGDAGLSRMSVSSVMHKCMHDLY